MFKNGDRVSIVALKGGGGYKVIGRIIGVADFMYSGRNYDVQYVANGKIEEKWFQEDEVEAADA